MSLEDFKSYEVVGIANTIREYTRNHFVLSYTDILIETSKSDDYIKMIGVIERLVKWYDVVLEKMENDKYLYNKEQHVKGYQLLKSAQFELQSITN
jgi:uncharacterized protein (DUF4213/DUF364 family)